MTDDTALPETWRPVVGYEGAYEVSDRGGVRGLARSATRPSGVRVPVSPIVLRPSRGKYGHLSVRLARSGRCKAFYVHRLVMEAFVGPAPDGHECCHRDGDAGNNSLSNLRWGTPSSNNYDRTTHRTNPQVLRQQCPLGHDLVEPNLVRYKQRLGFRSCRACQGAYQVKMRRARCGNEVDFRAVADARYGVIMTGGR